ncbi:hypothetical protein CC86DRAFT_380653 [Ophiobolus disseminans]|uniref:Uncharacterized protein n=1 Tax=Ophiobolus disseminans TaxID=1469910 RepID=A0A6A7A856_9PLEO|nr:hypothetical protein CC86DRAFT_380653 [Ophiobolus disseminans]
MYVNNPLQRAGPAANIYTPSTYTRYALHTPSTSGSGSARLAPSNRLRRTRCKGDGIGSLVGSAGLGGRVSCSRFATAPSSGSWAVRSLAKRRAEGPSSFISKGGRWSQDDERMLGVGWWIMVLSLGWWVSAVPFLCTKLQALQDAGTDREVGPNRRVVKCGSDYCFCSAKEYASRPATALGRSLYYG